MTSIKQIKDSDLVDICHSSSSSRLGLSDEALIQRLARLNALQIQARLGLLSDQRAVQPGTCLGGDMPLGHECARKGTSNSPIGWVDGNALRCGHIPLATLPPRIHGTKRQA